MLLMSVVYNSPTQDQLSLRGCYFIEVRSRMRKLKETIPFLARSALQRCFWDALSTMFPGKLLNYCMFNIFSKPSYQKISEQVVFIEENNNNKNPPLFLTWICAKTLFAKSQTPKTSDTS